MTTQDPASTEAKETEAAKEIEAEGEPEPAAANPLLVEAEQKLKAHLGDDLLGTHIPDSAFVNDLNIWVRVTNQSWQKAGLFIRDILDCSWFDFISAIDWMESPYGRQLDAEQDGNAEPKAPPPLEFGVLGGETRLQILARVQSTRQKLGVILKADLPNEAPVIESWVPVFAGADWHEREAWEMFGIVFEGHPGLRHIYLPSEFEGNPLRKDFPLLARRVKPWPGIVDVELMPDEDPDQAQNSTPEDASNGEPDSSGDS